MCTNFLKTFSKQISSVFIITVTILTHRHIFLWENCIPFALSKHYSKSYDTERRSSFSAWRPSGASSITCRLNSLLQDYTRPGFVVTRQFFSRLFQFAIQEHVVIHLNCFYQIQGLITRKGAALPHWVYIAVSPQIHCNSSSFIMFTFSYFWCNCCPPRPRWSTVSYKPLEF